MSYHYHYQARLQQNCTDLLARKLLERYDKLHSANCDNVKQYRQTLLKRLTIVLPLSDRPERVVNGHLI